MSAQPLAEMSRGSLDKEAGIEAHRFFDKALSDFLRESLRTEDPVGERINAAAAAFSTDASSANELVRRAIGIPLLVGMYYVERGELTKQSALEAAPGLIIEVAQNGPPETFTGRLADAAEALWRSP